MKCSQLQTHTSFSPSFEYSEHVIQSSVIIINQNNFGKKEFNQKS